MLTIRLSNYVLPSQLSFFSLSQLIPNGALFSDNTLDYAFCYNFEIEYLVYEQLSSDFWFWQFVESCMQELGEYMFECSRFFGCVQRKYREYLMARASENE